MSAANRFGPVFTGGKLERAIISHLTAANPVTGGNWLSTALAEVEREEGIAPFTLERPRHVVTSSEFEKMPEVQLPCVLVITPGLTRPPERKGDGTLALTWGVGLAAIVTDVDQGSTRLIGQMYAAALQTAISRKPALGIGARTVFADERYDDLDFGDGRTLGAGRAVFEVTVQNARTVVGGPLRPVPEGDPTDPGPWPTITDTSIEVEKIPTTEAVR